MERKTNLSTNISGFTLDNPLINASGCWCTLEQELNELLDSASGAVVSKSSSVEARTGNRQPRINYAILNGSINSMGVPNLGYQFYKDWHRNNIPDKKLFRKPFFHSVIPLSENDLEILLTECCGESNLVELNLSCPNIAGKRILAYDFEQLDKTFQQIASCSRPNLGVKLPPYHEAWEFDRVSAMLERCDQIKFITTINSIVNGLLVDPHNETTLIHPKNGLGGIGGSYCLPTALSNVNNFYRRLGDKIYIIGCGGVRTGEDAFSHILCGASAVAIGTTLMKESPYCFGRIQAELRTIMKNKKYSCIQDFRGKLKVIESDEPE